MEKSINYKIVGIYDVDPGRGELPSYFSKGKEGTGKNEIIRGGPNHWDTMAS